MKSNQDDLVSVILPFYNEKNYFDDCIKSVLAQTYKNLEIIIINDGSDPEYLESLQTLKNTYPEKIFLYHKENEGVSSARNLGIKKAKGNLICLLDSDDRWEKDKLELQVNAFSSKKTIYTTAAKYFDSKDLKSGFLINFIRILLQIFFIHKINNKGFHWFYICIFMRVGSIEKYE